MLFLMVLKYLSMNIGLVLSGGGARGVAHIGAIKALTEHNINITHVAGTSSGAVVGALFAAGYTWQEMFKFFKSILIFHYTRYAHKKPGFFDSLKFEKDFLKVFPDNDFSSLQKKLYITATNLTDGSLKVFTSGPLIKPMLASASVPGVFTPVTIKDGVYVDGGILNNFPIEPLVTSCKRIVGVYVNPMDDLRGKKLIYSYQVMLRAYQIAIGHQSKLKFRFCDILILPNRLVKYGMFSLKNLDTIFEMGYQVAKKEIHKREHLFKNDILKTTA